MSSVHITTLDLLVLVVPLVALLLCVAGAAVVECVFGEYATMDDVVDRIRDRRLYR